jgi:transcriptional regulator with XRE-family HTH domain
MPSPKRIAYVAGPTTGQPQDVIKRTQAISVQVAHACRREDYDADLWWFRTYPDDRRRGRGPDLYSTERLQMQKADVLIAIETAGSTGLGGLIEIASQNLMPIIFVHWTSAPVSEMGRARAERRGDTIIDITHPQEVYEPLRDALSALKPLLDKRADWPVRRMPPACSQRIRDAREAARWSVDDLAEALGVPPAKVVDIENGDTVPNQYLIRVIAHLLGYNTTAFFLNEEGFEATKYRNFPHVYEFCDRNGKPASMVGRILTVLERRDARYQGPPSEGELWLITRAIENHDSGR